MTRVRILAALTLCCAFSVFPALSEPVTWLMQGELLNENESVSWLRLRTHRTYLPVSTRAEVSYRATHGEIINCVIAAAVHQKGHVSVVEGGYGAKRVLVRYVTKKGQPDTFFVLVQFAKKDSVLLEGDLASNSRIGIVYQPMRNWTMEEVQDALRNASSSLLPS